MENNSAKNAIIAELKKGIYGPVYLKEEEETFLIRIYIQKRKFVEFVLNKEKEVVFFTLYVNLHKPLERKKVEKEEEKIVYASLLELFSTHFSLIKAINDFAQKKEA